MRIVMTKQCCPRACLQTLHLYLFQVCVLWHHGLRLGSMLCAYSRYVPYEIIATDFDLFCLFHHIHVFGPTLHLLLCTSTYSRYLSCETTSADWGRRAYATSVTISSGGLKCPNVQTLPLQDLQVNISLTIQKDTEYEHTVHYCYAFINDHISVIVPIFPSDLLSHLQKLRQLLLITTVQHCWPDLSVLQTIFSKAMQAYDLFT